MPIEFDENVLAAIQLATGFGIVVVEAAGNGKLVLDDYASLNRTAREFQESRATLVGAASRRWMPRGTPTIAGCSLPRPRVEFWSRVDCYAYGENVATAGPPAPSNPAGELGSGTGPTNRYRKDFGGTSAAAAMVSGAAACSKE